MKTKIPLWSVVSILMTVIAVCGAESSPSPGIVLSDGTKLTLLGVTRGRHHVAPGFETLATGNWINSPANDTTVIWIKAEHDPSRWPSYQLLISDEANTASISTEVTSRSHVENGVDIQGFQLRAYPRWDKTMILRVAPYSGGMPKEHFLVVNPQPGSFGPSKAEPLPDTQSDGDFEVTLTKFITGVPSLTQYVRGAPTNDVANQCVRLAFDFKQKGQSVTNWHPRLVDTSDAAGNHVRGVIYPYITNRNEKPDGYFYQPGLWPDEPAWKVRLEFTRTSGFDDDEILTLTNLPVRAGTQKDRDDEWTWEPGETNLVIGSYTLNGIELKLFPPLLIPDSDHPDQKRISVIMRASPNPESKDMRLTLLKATDDQGREFGTASAPGAGYNCTFEFPNAHDTKTLSLKFALHKSRIVEFTVKPARQ